MVTNPTTRDAYNTHYEVLDRALESPSGIRVSFDSREAAMYFRLRLHTARTLDRDLNTEAREPDDPRYGTTEYANLIIKAVTKEEGKWWIYIKHSVRIDELEIEELET